MPDACGQSAGWDSVSDSHVAAPVPLIRSPDKRLLNDCDGPGTVLGTGKTGENKIGTFLIKLVFYWAELDDGEETGAMSAGRSGVMYREPRDRRRAGLTVSSLVVRKDFWAEDI